MTIPDIGDVFTYGDHTYRVNGWLKPHPNPTSTTSPHGPDRMPLVFCVRDEAVYVCGYGICGLIARVADVAVTGRVTWAAADVDRHRRSHQLLVGRELF